MGNQLGLGSTLVQEIADDDITRADKGDDLPWIPVRVSLQCRVSIQPEYLRSVKAT